MYYRAGFYVKDFFVFDVPHVSIQRDYYFDHLNFSAINRKVSYNEGILLVDTGRFANRAAISGIPFVLCLRSLSLADL